MTAAGDLHKQREIQFAKFPPDQVPEAAEDLRQLDALDVVPAAEKRALGVEYQLTAHTLKDIEAHLVDQGYHLDNALLNKLKRALIHYIEETQLHNLDAPEKLLKKTSEVFVKDWEQHPHGDRDETPPEWRDYK